MRYFLILLFAFLTACGSTVPVVKPFKMDIQQGNVVTSKMLLQLKPGMTKSQVKFIMGTPLIVDSFHKDRWDYFYQLRQAGKIVEQRRVILDFDKDLLTKVRGDVVPEGTSGAATGNESAVAKTITLEPKPKQEKSWTDKLKFWKKDEPAKEAEKPSVAREKNDAPEASKQAPASDTPSTDVTSGDVTSSDTPSVVAVPIGGVLAPEAPAVDVPVVVMPVIEAPVVTAPAIEATPAEMLKPAEAPQVEIPKEPEPIPATKEGERLIFRMDRNLDLNNVQGPTELAPVEAAPAPKAEIKSDAKPKKIEPPLPPEEAPDYFERMLEKIGF